MIKRYRTLVYLSLLIPILGICLVNILYLIVLKRDAAQGRWIEEPIAKSYLLAAAEDPDYIFLGSSRTQNHINSRLLGSLGVKVLNLGMAGREWEYYPYVIRQTGRLPGGTLVISIPAEALFVPVSCPDSYFYRLQLDWLGATDIGCFSIGALVWDDLLNELPMNRFRIPLEQVQSADELAMLLKALEDGYGYHPAKDGRQVNYVRGVRDRYVLLYTNGDGQVFSDRVKNSRGISRKTEDRSRDEFHPQAVAYLGKLAGLARQYGKDVIYIIEPRKVGIKEHIDIDKLRSLLPEYVRIINNAEKDYPRHLWADKNHFTLEGSELYSELVYSELEVSGSAGTQ